MRTEVAWQHVCAGVELYRYLLMDRGVVTSSEAAVHTGQMQYRLPCVRGYEGPVCDSIQVDVFLATGTWARKPGGDGGREGHVRTTYGTHLLT